MRFPNIRDDKTILAKNRTLKQILADKGLNLSTNPRGTDKADYKSYVDKFYEVKFAPLRETRINLMEIGFRHGASLALWAEYFKSANILGVDNFSDDAVTEGHPVDQDWISHPNIKTAIGDAYSKEFADRITDKFDVIIDDGPHTLESQMKSLELYLPKLNDHGIFVIEDILSGGLAIFPLLSKVDYRIHKCYFYDFRWHKLVGDNCLFVVQRRSSQKKISRTRVFIGRFGIMLLGVLYLIIEKPARFAMPRYLRKR